jgi:glycosyltransferase involved in cell wall biosynthesis
VLTGTAVRPSHQGPIEGEISTERRPRTAARVEATARKVLLVSYHFPPDSRVGAVRPAKFAKYLTRFGWQPYVLTIKTRHIPVPDPRRVDEVQSVPTVRTAVWPTLTDALLHARHWLLGLFRSARPGGGAWRVRSAVVDSPARPPRDGADRRSWRLTLRRVLYAIFEFPDNEVGWVIPAVWRGFRLIRREGIPLVLVTSPPRSSVLIGLILSRLTGARLVTDLRDPWYSREPLVAPARLSGSDRLRAWLERQLIERSDDVITTTDRYTGLLRRNYPGVEPERFHTITNGYDAEDFARIQPVTPDATFTMSYLGTFYWTRTPGPLLAALSDLVRSGVIRREVLRVNFIGTVNDAEGESVEDLVRGYGLDGCVTIRGVVPYEQSLIEMKKSAVLVLIAPEVQSYGIPAKTFEYIAIERPILCLGDRGATADLIRQSGSGVVVNPADIFEIRRAIEQLYRAWRDGQPMSTAFDKTVFERATLTRELIDILT